ncbi:AarF/ABC1/UbiB kinase family protein [Roseospira marina]|uniref:AarF/ABC1/UbiB kinase family protein n=1 Tax=Roseospira marina TaxID=140057 RepID=A0A5M6IIB5_9PROT|nr:AarF/ABC1/UbiB kinase family protein [Roseospira marina]KAA5607425.1 AarF/ABC1/UbiB kinase family protein [Roseospira marina]MBB4312399.1 putative unusual protein kinase regulating ubiquinone biosynthesis (AarF/ABC1/UbiB family) [Roseospira marina]MBB5085585.1 putative unusual protein kinase regulating ubiquinone biosynthesis (AarF/ABC1/UbiB family) [Roseospira marina]
MPDEKPDSHLSKSRARTVPSGRLERVARFGGLASGIAGTMAWNGARQMASGTRPQARDLLLTPANARRVADQLAHMRGAAMKVGQLISMDAGDMLPPELAEILGRLRSDAHFMPGSQLKTVLTKAWGATWLKRFAKFDTRPIAAASIGQVHRARTVDGRDLAIKVQYPGVRRSIDSDVNNVATLMRLSGVMPKTLDITPMLDEAKRQLHEEADYAREGHYLQRFGALLADAPEFVVPRLYTDLTTTDVLAMDYVEGVAIDTLATAPQATRDRVMAQLIGLVFRELFAFRMMQTDPNFANYRYQPESGRIVLLDFGASREFAPGMATQFRRLLNAGLDGDRAAIRATLLDIGFFAEATAAHHQDSMVDMFELSMEPLRRPGAFDFANNDLALRMRDAGMALGHDRDFWHIPPMDTLFMQRKFSGFYFLASRLKARVDLRGIVEPYL